MKYTLVPKMMIENCHPKGMPSSTDMEYARIATEITSELAKQDVKDIPLDGLKLMAVNITMYFEDVIADAGIWRGFTNEMKERYGSYLPFYDIDTDNYYQDEPNLDDVRFLIWYTMLQVHYGKIGNPENPLLDKLAVAAYNVLEKHFETVSVNEDLKEYFANPQFLDDFYKQRDILKWLCYGCYLTYIPDIQEMLFEQAQDLAHSMHCDLDFAHYLAESLMPYQSKIGPLKELPQQWAAMIMRANGNDAAAEAIGSQRKKGPHAFKLLSVSEDMSVTFESIDGENFSVRASNLNNPREECYKRKLIIGSFVQYDGQWYLNGGSAWSDNIEMFEESQTNYTNQKNIVPLYEELRKKAGDNPLLYFADTEAMSDFMKHNLPLGKGMEKGIQFPPGHKHILVYVPLDNEKDFEIYPDGALCVKDERNPYYNAKYAKNQAINFVLSVSDEVRDYLISNKLLPDATINSVYGLERGNEIVQQNFDFLIRAVSSRL